MYNMKVFNCVVVCIQPYNHYRYYPHKTFLALHCTVKGPRAYI